MNLNDCMSGFVVDSVEDAERWLRGLELLREETLLASTPEIIERYVHMCTFIPDIKSFFKELLFFFLDDY